MVLMLRKAAWRAPWVRRTMAIIDAAERRDIDGLAADHTSGPDAARILTGTGVDDGVGHDLDGVLAGDEVDDLQGVLHDAAREHLLTVVAAVHHEGVGEALHDRALGLLEALLLPAAGRVGQEAGILRVGGDVVREGDLADTDVIESPYVEQLDLGGGTGHDGELPGQSPH